VFFVFQVLNKDDDSWTPIRYGMLAIKDGGKSSWRDGRCALLDSHCEQLRHHPSLGLTRFSVVLREGNKLIRDDQVQSCNQGKRVTASPYYLPTYASPLI
jgi:hypothetical protein